MPRLIFPLFFLLAGCVSLDDVVGGIANTPEWFQQRRVEIRGEGYPDLRDVPDETNVRAIGKRLQATEALTRKEVAAFLADPRNEAAGITSEEISQTAAQLRSLLPVSEAGEYDGLLSSAEIEQLRARLKVPPVNKKQ